MFEWLYVISIEPKTAKKYFTSKKWIIYLAFHYLPQLLRFKSAPIISNNYIIGQMFVFLAIVVVDLITFKLSQI